MPRAETNAAASA